MCGNDVFKFASRMCGVVVQYALEIAHLKVEDLDWIAPHQANLRIIEAAAKRLGVSMKKMLCNIQKYGNTSTASIPLLLDDALNEGKIVNGSLVALVSFGSGMTYGSTIMRWGKGS